MTPLGNAWFGEHWGSPICVFGREVDPPIGAICPHCEELIGPDDSGIVSEFDEKHFQASHRACVIRALVGSVGHQMKVCSCYGGDGPEDPPELTLREAAEAAEAWHLATHKYGLEEAA